MRKVRFGAIPIMPTIIVNELSDARIYVDRSNGVSNVQGSIKPDSQSIAAIIVNFNGGDPLLDCLQSLKKQTIAPSEIVVVDNRSNDGSLKKVRNSFPDVKVIENDYNAGWGVGCNIGIRATRSAYVALINNDAYLDPLCLEEMIRAIQLRPDYGSCAGKILLWDDPKTIEVAGIAIYKDGSSIGRGRLQPDTLYDDLEEVFCASGCCGLYRRRMLNDIGLFDPDFFMYCDDTDLGWRQQLRGWRCIYAPKAIAYHAHSRSSGDYSDFKAYHVERNRFFLCLKYFPFPYLVASIFFAGYRYVRQIKLSHNGKGALAKYRLNHSIGQGLRILIQSQWDAIRKLPVMRFRGRKFRSIHPFRLHRVPQLLHHYSITAKQVARYE